MIIIFTDTVGPLLKSNNGNQYILTIIFDLSKYLITVPLSDKSAKSVACAIFENFILIHGPMKSMRSDLGTEYNNELIRELCVLLKIEHQLSTAYRHQSVGTVERNHRVLNEYLRAYVSENITQWEEYLKYFTFCYNITENTALDCKFSPFELIFSKKPNLPIDLLNGNIDPIYNLDNYVKEAKYRLQTAHQRASKIIEKLKVRNKIYYDKDAKPTSIKPNDLVLIERKPYDKFESVYKGPYKVDSVSGSNVTIVDTISKRIRNRKYIKIEQEYIQINKQRKNSPNQRKLITNNHSKTKLKKKNYIKCNCNIDFTILLILSFHYCHSKKILKALKEKKKSKKQKSNE